MRVILIDKNGEITLGDKVPAPVPSQIARIGALHPVLPHLLSTTAAAQVEIFVFRGYIALKDGQDVAAIYEETL